MIFKLLLNLYEMFDLFLIMINQYSIITPNNIRTLSVKIIIIVSIYIMIEFYLIKRNLITSLESLPWK